MNRVRIAGPDPEPDEPAADSLLAGEAWLLGRPRELVLPTVVLLDQRARPFAPPKPKTNIAAKLRLPIPASPTASSVPPTSTELPNKK